ncbi:MAG: hypothetical protein K9L59_05925 [Desulfobacterales bacterium]|nr:hypothetical protein [Desulfobacterales bacterium]
MAEKIGRNDWLWVMVQNPGQAETIVGMHDEKGAISFIPMFREKDAALQCFLNLPRKAGKKYEAQAIIYEDLLRHAAENRFLLYLLDEDGKILKKVDPVQEK